MIIPTIFCSALFPLLSKYNTDKSRLIKLTQESLAILLMIGLPICFGGIFLAREIITLIFSDNYVGATATFQCLLIASLLIFCYLPLNNLLLATNQEYKCIKNSSKGCLINIVLNCILIPLFGIVGAGIGTVVGRAALIKLHFSTLRNDRSITSLLLKRNINYLSFSIMMVAGIHIMQNVTQNTPILIAFGALIYISLILLSNDPSIKKIKDLLLIDK